MSGISPELFVTVNFKSGALFAIRKLLGEIDVLIMNYAILKLFFI